MSGKNDTAYYWIRAAEELEKAAQAVNPAVAAVHHDLAFRYGARAARCASEPAGGDGLNGDAAPSPAQHVA